MDILSPPPNATANHAMTIRFTGSGSEYFRIWSVNLLLTLVTLGTYYPWAKVRRLRYFYGNTFVGDHPLDFHGRPTRMLRGYVLVGAMAVLYSVAGKISPLAGLIAVLIVAAVWPALFRAAQQFRLANTSWRGLRFRFTGSLAGAYRAMLAWFIPGALALLAGFFAGRAASDAATALSTGAGVLAGLASLAIALLFPLLWWLLKKYQHDHITLGQMTTELRTGPGAFYAVVLKIAGVGLLAVLAGLALTALLGAGGALAALGGGGARGTKVSPALFAALFIGMFFAYGSVLLVVYPYSTSRMQNLVWSRTTSDDIRFDSALRFWPLFGLTVKNWALVLVTLGLYWPFAAVAMARMRLEAVSMQTRLSPDDIVSQTRPRSDDATGDAAGDLFGIDIGL